MQTTAIIILAAGESSRMGTSKQLLEVRGKTLLERVVGAALESGDYPIIVVLGAHAAAHQGVVSSFKNVSSVVNQDWESGLGSSIRTGLSEAIRLHPELDGALFLVCDQPHVDAKHLFKILNAFDSTPANIIASAYKDTEGVPALFGKKYFAELLALQNKEGAKRIIEKYPEDKLAISFPEGVVDLDTPADFRDFMNKLK
jgi:CTP:molybdopterin cytidylyltransferase MocA